MNVKGAAVAAGVAWLLAAGSAAGAAGFDDCDTLFDRRIHRPSNQSLLRAPHGPQH